MDFLLELFGEFVFEMIGEAFSGVLVLSGRSMRDALSEGGSVGSLFGQSPWWRS
jgi:hypothetical protein